MIEMLKAAKAAKSQVSALTENEKNNALEAMAAALEADTEVILAANRSDCSNAEGTVSPVMLDRLMLSAQRIAAMAEGIRSVRKLEDPAGKILDRHIRRDGLEICKVSVPMGVIAIIYESRPNVTSDAAALALKSGNVCILKCGKEAAASARAIVASLRRGLALAGVCENAVNLVEDPTRESAVALMQAQGYVDLLIPRGGAGLISSCVRQATVPCIATGTGICHVYVDKSADLNMALDIVENAKTSRPSVCNAEEVLLVDQAAAPAFLPELYQRLVVQRKERGLIPVELRLDRRAADIISGRAAEERDFDTEFLDYILAVRCVDGVQEAVSHIAEHSTGHSEAIISDDPEVQRVFAAGVDSAAVYINASTRFTDGGEFGLGCEMGISTQKLHARGPMGLKELTTYKYIIRGAGHIR